jgi:two-component system KDP operon response regulator KdpE
LSTQPNILARILVVDDEPQIRRFLRISLSAHGYGVLEAGRGADGIKKCAAEKPSLVILDLGLPDMDGLDVVAAIRERSQVPIVVLSVRSSEQDKITALDRGANDYVAKPFGVGELLARVRVALRLNGRADDAAEVRIGELCIDIAARRVQLSGADVRLTRKEFDILSMLAQNAGRIVTHQQMLRTLWGPAQEHETHYLRVYVGHLRQKLGDDPANPRFIENEPGVGYRLMAES